MSHVSIDYCITDYSHAARDNLLTEAEQNAEAGRLRAKHLGGICRMLSLIDISRGFDQAREIGEPYSIPGTKLDEISRDLNAVGELGIYLADSLYCNVLELNDAYEDAVTFTDEEVSE